MLVGRSAEGGQCQFCENLPGQSHQVMHPKHLIREAKYLKYTSNNMYTNEKKAKQPEQSNNINICNLTSKSDNIDIKAMLIAGIKHSFHV